ncbi:hypothetical protein FLAV_00886 [Flavobacteriales bacterium]|nr:hypothetical protein FLAV_00886 [Flavobacteriales bacterium]
MKKTKIGLTVLIIVFSLNASWAQNLEKETTKLWWNIYGGCFSGTHLTKRNSLFMSTANNISSGSAFTLKRNVVNQIIDKGLRFDYSTLKLMEGFPTLKNDSLSATPPCTFLLDYASTTGVDVYGKLVDEANIGKINAELQTILKNAKALKPTISKWGIDYIEEGSLILYLTSELNKGNKTVGLLTNGEHYISTMGIWIKGINFSYELDKEVVQKVKTIYESNKVDFLEVGVKIDFSSETTFSTTFDYKDKFYPFLKFKKIQTSGYIKIKNKQTPILYLEDLDLLDIE